MELKLWAHVKTTHELLPVVEINFDSGTCICRRNEAKVWYHLRDIDLDLHIGIVDISDKELYIHDIVRDKNGIYGCLFWNSGLLSITFEETKTEKMICKQVHEWDNKEFTWAGTWYSNKELMT